MVNNTRKHVVSIDTFIGGIILSGVYRWTWPEVGENPIPNWSWVLDSWKSGDEDVKRTC